MEEAVLERIQKDKVDEQWNEFYKAEAETKEGAEKPTDKQKTYIVSLAKTVGLKVDVSTIKDRQKASLFIERLKMLSRRMNGNGYDYELRDRRVAFGMATKLIFKKYLDRHKEFRRSKKFWKEVEEFYGEYQKQQERVIHSPVST